MKGIDKIKYLNSLTRERACVAVFGFGREMEDLADALVGMSEDERAIYDYDALVDSFVKSRGVTCEEAVKWANDKIKEIPFMGPGAPIIMKKIPEDCK